MKTVFYVVATLAILIFGFVTIRNSIYRNKTQECITRYGQDFHYTFRSATDCINDRTGEGRFL